MSRGGDGWLYDWSGSTGEAERSDGAGEEREPERLARDECGGRTGHEMGKRAVQTDTSPAPQQSRDH